MKTTLREGDAVYLNGDYYGQRLWNSRLMPILFQSAVPMTVMAQDEESGDVLVSPDGPHQTFWMQRSWLRGAL